MEKGRIPVAVVDADMSARGGLDMLVLEDEDRFDLVDSASTPRALVRARAARALVLDPAPAGRFEPSVLEGARANAPEAALVIYTNQFLPESVLPALECGIKAYLLKGRTSGEALLDIVYFLASSPLVAVDEVVRDFFAREPGRLRTGPTFTPPQVLSRREREVLELVSKGLYDEEIGARFGTSRNTVHNQVRAAVEKLGARNREHAVLLAVRYGLIDPYA